MEQKRDTALDVAKALCIMFMVAGHTACPKYFHDFVYMFHMPCFFFISGWLLNDRYVKDLKTGLLRKIRGTYYPFVKWSVIFILLHNVFTTLHVYNTTYTIQETLVRIVRVFTLTVRGGEGLLGGYWFLTSLFLASVMMLVFLHILDKYGKLRREYVVGGVLFSF